MSDTGTVYFIGAGPGDPELITVKGQRIIAEADLVLYAGSLVPTQIVEQARAGARVVDSAPLTLQQTHALLLECVRGGGTAARVHTGDPALYGAVREQMRLLDTDGVNYAVVPGVPSAFAAAAEACVSFTVPEATQTLTLTRLAGRTPVPEAEDLAALAGRGGAMAVYLSAGMAPQVRQKLLQGGYPPETTVVIGHKVGWPGGGTVRTTLDHMAEAVRRESITRQAVFLVLPGQEDAAGAEQAVSRLYDRHFSHGYRNGEPSKDSQND